MNKLIHALTAGASMLILTSGISLAADQTHPTEETAPRSSENQPGDPAPVTTGNEKAQQSDEYAAALKKCDSVQDSKRQKCIAAADKKYGHM